MFCEKCGNQLDGNAKFCPNCGHKLEGLKEAPSNPVIAQSVKKKKVNTCSVLSIVFASIGIVPLLNILFLPPAIILAIIGVATGKNKGKKAKIASIIVLIISILISLLWMIPAITGISLFPSNDDTGTEKTTCAHSYSFVETEATCQSGGYATYRCSLCNKEKREYQSALGHTTSTGTCSRCGKSFAAWEIAFYVDEFNNPTNDAYLRNSDIIYGSFSNSATTNSTLYARILIDTEDIAIKLWEYGSNVVEAYTSTDYNITILDDSGQKHYTTGKMYKNGDRIVLEDWTIVNLLQKNTQLKIYIQENSKYGVNSTYLFTIENGNFNSIYYNFYHEYME